MDHTEKRRKKKALFLLVCLFPPTSNVWQWFEALKTTVWQGGMQPLPRLCNSTFWKMKYPAQSHAG